MDEKEFVWHRETIDAGVEQSLRKSLMNCFECSMVNPVLTWTAVPWEKASIAVNAVKWMPGWAISTKTLRK
jgi:hypothetical protein